MGIVVFDLDDTITRGDSFVRFLLKCLGTHPLRLLRCVHLPFAVAAHFIGLRNNTWLKVVFLRAILAGLTRQQLQSISIDFAETTISDNLKSKAVAEIARHRDAGHTLILASASPDVYVAEIGARLGFHQVVATQLQWCEDEAVNRIEPAQETKICSGFLSSNNCYGSSKVAALKEQVSNKDSDYIAAYSDHHSDLPLLQLAQHGYAIDPTSRLREAANDLGIEILIWE